MTVVLAPELLRQATEFLLDLPQIIARDLLLRERKPCVIAGGRTDIDVVAGCFEPGSRLARLLLSWEVEIERSQRQAPPLRLEAGPERSRGAGTRGRQ